MSKEKEVCEKSIKYSIQVDNEMRIGIIEKLRENIFDQIGAAYRVFPHRYMIQIL
jgi:hypothetical protein